MTTYTLDDVRKMGAGKSYSIDDVQAMQPSFMDELAQQGKNLLGGAVRGAGSIGATVLSPIDAAARLFGMQNDFIGRTDRREQMDAGVKSLGSDPESFSFGAAKLGTEIAGTSGVGGVLAKGVSAVAPKLFSSSPVAAKVLEAINTAGFKTGAPAAANMPGKAADLGIRALGGGVTGGVSAGLVNPDDAATGAIIGGALPSTMAAIGKTGSAIGSKLGTPKVPDELLQWVKNARDAGYVVPPTQAKPTFTNRMLEGFSGKITTAQNASAKNQPITNELARKGIGADDLSAKGVQKVEDAAHSAYNELAKVGRFETDDAFRGALQKAGSVSTQMRKDFPELINSEVDDLVSGLSSRDGFDAQSTINAIKQFRFDGSSNKVSMDPAKKALGNAQMKIANSLEDLIDRNLEKIGAQDLLSNYRSARQTLAKVYDVKKAMNAATGNVDAAYLGKLLDKGRPLTGELRTIAEFSKQFPKAVQSVEKMGSLPQVSPLDFGALGTVSALTSNPWLLAGVAARPAARSLVLSDFVQNGLTKQVGQGGLAELFSNPTAQQFLYRSAPTIGGSR